MGYTGAKRRGRRYGWTEGRLTAREANLRPRQPIDESRWRLNHHAAVERFVFKAAHLVADEGEYAGGLWGENQRKGQIGYGHLM